ncbi:hypothetical protein BO82DRAFT_219120 [Aspergillus uvarum CBS 121591]|uniref:Uncharacterized protein n=1 Tax=Aspergillus uvarum CBS 121591 TaxID=1448315 RepID=A0A319BTV2_9EURO|nr:hypothetical protein BO82DRAFT_219120 [Aspergillus uvarum CBS 121591]PYH76014.1 hypothetical protein BO82DRAFT_219120 [Aspergillus uvarum CBS 121591]
MVPESSGLRSPCILLKGFNSERTPLSSAVVAWPCPYQWMDGWMGGCMYVCMYVSIPWVSHIIGTLPLPTCWYLNYLMLWVLAVLQTAPANADFFALALPALPVSIALDGVQDRQLALCYILSRTGILDLSRESHQLPPRNHRLEGQLRSNRISASENRGTGRARTNHAKECGKFLYARLRLHG